MTRQSKSAGRHGDVSESAESEGNEPMPTRLGYIVSLAVVLIGLGTQLVLAQMVHGSLPPQIPGSFLGLSDPYTVVPSWVVFVAFPCAQLVLLALTILSPIAEDGKRVMETGKCVTLSLLSALFTVLQGSAFRFVR